MGNWQGAYGMASDGGISCHAINWH